MKTKNTLAGVLLLLFISCTGTDKKVQAAIDSTKTVISYWDRHLRDSIYSDEAQKRFTDQFNSLVQHNKTQGIVKEKLNAELIKEVEQLYSHAQSIKSKMAVSEMQLDMGRRGANWAGEKIKSGKLNTDF